MEIQKAKIVDLNADYAVVLTDCGAFKRVVRKGNMSVGGGIYITDQDLYMNISASKSFKRPLFSKRLLQMTGVMALLIMILFTQSLTPMSYAVISVDINPSIQLFIDSDYNVVKIESMNADGKKLLSEYDFIKKKSASSVLTELFTLAKQMDYLKSGENEILVAAAIYEPSKANENTLQITNDTDELLDTILSDVDYSVFEQESVVINAVASNAKNIEAAEKEHLTIGQFEKGRHSETIKPYIIVEDGKQINTNTQQNENAADTSNEDRDGSEDDTYDHNKKDNDATRNNDADKNNGSDRNNGTDRNMDSDKTNDKNNDRSNGTDKNNERNNDVDKNNYRSNDVDKNSDKNTDKNNDKNNVTDKNSDKNSDKNNDNGNNKTNGNFDRNTDSNTDNTEDADYGRGSDKGGKNYKRNN